MQELQVRRLTREADYQATIDYFLLSEDEFLLGMRADRKKFPERSVWLRKLLADHKTADAHKDRCYLEWIYRGELVGHSSLSKIRVGEDGYIHLHMWPSERQTIGWRSGRLRNFDLWARPGVLTAFLAAKTPYCHDFNLLSGAKTPDVLN
jgi:hypothetical protein